MAISGLQQLLEDRRLLKVSPLEELRNSVIGVDVDHFVASILDENTEIKYEALGGFPLTLESLLDKQLKLLNSYDIKLLFVFSGLKPQYILESQKANNNEKIYSKAWEGKGNGKFRAKEYPINTKPFTYKLMKLLNDKGVEYLVAPYFAHHQLDYLLKENVINAIMSSNDSLLFKNVKKLICNFGMGGENFTYVNIFNVLRTLEIDFKQFKDISMITSNFFQPHKLSNKEFPFYLTNLASLHTYVTMETSKAQFLKGLAILEFTPVLKINGRVEPLALNFARSFLEGPPVEPNAANVPGDIYSVLGAKLPDELFFYQSIGLSCLQTTESISTVIEKLSVDLLNSPLYEKLILSSTSIQIKSDLINLLTLKFNRAFQRMPVKIHAYLKSNAKPIESSISRGEPEYRKFVESLIVHQSFGETFILDHFLLNLSNNFVKECQRPVPAYLSTNYELIGTSFLRSLITYGLIGNDGTISKWGEVLVKFIRQNKIDNELALLITIFFKRLPEITPTLLCEPTLSPLSESANSLTKDQFKLITLISKFGTLYNPEEVRMECYQGQISRELRHFNSITSKLYGEINECVSVHMVTLLLSNWNDYEKVSRDVQSWKDISFDLPFRQNLNSTLSGLLIQTVLEQKLTNNEINLTSFDSVLINPLKESQNILKFNLKIIKLVQSLGDANLIPKDVVTLFNDAKTLIESVEVNL